MRVVIYGGAFNPPHVSHLLAIQYLLQSSHFDQVWVLPSYQHAFDKKMVSFTNRVEMLRLMLQGMEQVEICEIEKEMTVPIYTYDVLSVLSDRYPDHTFSLSIGADNLTESYRWHRFGELIEKWGLYVFGRIGHEASVIAFQEKYKVKSLTVGPTLPSISSSEIRKTLSHHGSRNHLNFLIIPTCLPLIKQLYTRPEIMLFGYGKAGKAVKAYLEKYEEMKVGVWYRSLGDLPDYEEIENAIWLICVNDDQIQNVSEMLYQHYAHHIKPEKRNDFLIGHLSGLHTDQKLKSWLEEGFQCFVLHPLQALRDENSAKDLESAYFAVSIRDEHKAQVLEKLNQRLIHTKNRFFMLPHDQKSKYHLSAVFTSNLSLILVGIGIDFMRQAMHCSEKEAREKLMPLLRSTMLRLETQSVAEALTGPTVRKDLTTITQHLNLMEELELISVANQEEQSVSQIESLEKISKIREIYEKILLFVFRKDQEMLMKLNLE
jgi:nicotinate-nucleotide adenylyltransferase